MKKLSQNEAIGVFVALAVIGFIFLGMFKNNPFTHTETAQKPLEEKPITIVDSKNKPDAAISALKSATNERGEVTKLIMEDVVVGSGPEVKIGDTLTVNYVGILKNGTQFDNSYVRGAPFTFTIGQGKVIKGWDTGLIGMKKGGERVLIIPSTMAYGNRSVGQIPPNAALLFSIKLIDIK